MVVNGSAWARKLEGVEAELSLRTARRAGAEVWEAMGGWALNFGAGSPLSQVLGAGMGGAVSEGELEELERRFGRAGVAVTISLCPYAHASLPELLGRRGYRISHFEHTWLREMAERPGVPETAFEVRPLEAHEVDGAADAVCEAFFPGGSVQPELRALFPRLWSAEGGQVYVAADGEGIAGCGLALVSEGALLAGDGTRERARGRGMQSALIAARLRHAYDRGCRWATSSTAPGTASERNYERAGFRVAYTKALMVKE